MCLGKDVGGGKFKFYFGVDLTFSLLDAGHELDVFWDSVRVDRRAVAIPE